MLKEHGSMLLAGKMQEELVQNEDEGQCTMSWDQNPEVLQTNRLRGRSAQKVPWGVFFQVFCLGRSGAGG